MRRLQALGLAILAVTLFSLPALGEPPAMGSGSGSHATPSPAPAASPAGNANWTFATPGSAPCAGDTVAVYLAKGQYFGTQGLLYPNAPAYACKYAAVQHGLHTFPVYATRSDQFAFRALIGAGNTTMNSSVTLVLSGAITGSMTVATTANASQVGSTTIVLGDEQTVLWTSPSHTATVAGALLGAPSSANHPATISIGDSVPAAILAKARTIGILQQSGAAAPPAPQLVGKSFAAAGVATIMKPM